MWRSLEKKYGAPVLLENEWPEQETNEEGEAEDETEDLDDADESKEENNSEQDL